MASDNERWNLFVEGVQLVFKNWTALQLAVENGWGGHQSTEKVDEFMEDILYWFTLCKNDPDVFALQEQLNAAVLEDFHTEVEDGSLAEVAETLVTLCQQCRRGDTSRLETLRATDAVTPSRKANVTDDMKSESSSESEGMPGHEDGDAMQICREPAPKRAPETDSEGFTMVSSRRRR